MAKPSRRKTDDTRPSFVNEIRRLSELQVTEKEAAAFIGISLKEFRDRITHDVSAREAWESGREVGKVSIRRTQFKLAERNAQMAIFLGKVYLGQREIQVLEHVGADGGPIQTMDLGKLSTDQRKSLREILTIVRKRD